MTRPQRRGLGIGVVVALAIAGVIFARTRATGQSKSAPPAGRDAADRPVPVLVAKAVRRDVPIILEGLGSVTAYKTVNVHTQVDGRLDKVLFKEGQAVKEGEVIAQIDPRPFEIQLHTGQAALARDEAQLHGAEKNLERYQTVVQQQLIPQQQVDDQRTLVEQYRAATQGDQATIENAKLQLDYARIKSPLAGVTGVRQVDPGNLVHAADATPIVVVTQLDPIAVLFTLPQDDLGRVAQAQARGAVTVSAISRDGDAPIATGQLALVDNQINQSTATIRLKAVFPNPDKKLWPNQFVKARIQLDVKKGALVVPAVAVQHGPDGTFVYVVDGEKAAMKTITVALLQGDEAILGKGVDAGDAVIIEGQNQLRPGSKIVARANGGGKEGGGANAQGGGGAGGGGAGGGHHKRP
ncbi:MAG TPA: efflux RND transporter periplasmic adaptor subunit [Polyangia bacterium]|nr:efflux RND transporter periplasmic adaptor subunit [Polyangia bacterium]